MLIVGTIFMALPPVCIVLYVLLNYFVPGKRSVCVVVLGDIGRSPRMQYHALSFLKHGFSVDLVGYSGSDLIPGLKENDNAQLYNLWDVPGFVKGLPKLVQYILKVFWQTFTLASALLLMPKSGYILVQNPPCIPTFVVAIATCWLRGSRLVIDWHNYGYTILGLSAGAGSPIVKFARWYERFFGRFASDGICVTRAMQGDLERNWGIRATVMYDRPPAMFKEQHVNARHKLFLQLAKEYPVFRPSSGEVSPDETRFTVSNGNGDAYLIQKRPALVVSSTSWTEDEDFGVLLAALEGYESTLEEGADSLHLPDIICVITGKGPQKEYYREVIQSRQWKHVQFCLPWLKPEDYPVLLGCADLGICLHKSSSGLDLPMKVVDMFGCCLPVCAINFNCLSELVKHDENGLVFRTSEDLTNNLQDLLADFPHSCKKLDSFRKNLTGFQSTRWDDAWQASVLPIFDDQSTEADDKKSQ